MNGGFAVGALSPLNQLVFPSRDADDTGARLRKDGGAGPTQPAAGAGHAGNLTSQRKQWLARHGGHSVLAFSAEVEVLTGEILGQPYVSGAGMTLHAFKPGDPGRCLPHPAHALAGCALPRDNLHELVH